MNRKDNTALRGIMLGLTLFVLHTILVLIYNVIGTENEILITAASIALFLFTVTIFLLVKSFKNFFAVGFIGLGILIFTEIIVAANNLFDFLGDIISNGWFYIYFYGILGSFFGAVLAAVLTAKGISYMPDFSRSEKIEISRKNKYIILSNICVIVVFAPYLLFYQYSSLGVFIFGIVESVFLVLLQSEKKRLPYIIPIVIFSLNAFLSGNTMWKIPNLFLSLIIFILFFRDGNSDEEFYAGLLKDIIMPFKYFGEPFKWIAQTKNQNNNFIKRVALSFFICIPIVGICVYLMCSADLVFSKMLSDLLENIAEYINMITVYKVIFALISALYVSGIFFNSRDKKENKILNTGKLNGDSLIINIILTVISILYLVFIVIQIRYLFAGAKLPFGFTYAQYARKGFFEMFLLTGLNIFLIVATVNLLKENRKIYTEIMQYCLCIFTVILLVSSFYRMYLYTEFQGLTRLRFMVFGFLIFEFIGLLATLIYIRKPKILISVCYFSLGFIYYILLNIVPMDYFVAKSQIDRFFKGDSRGLSYVVTLSSDAAPQIKRLSDSNDEAACSFAQSYFSDIKGTEDSDWRSINLSVKKAKNN